MAKIKNAQNVFHVTKNGTKTACGLSNGYGLADSLEKFNERLNSNWKAYCCKKCETTIR